jgi:prepilin-type N-terminal cleavage/methylation domain-containing protein
LKKGDCGGFTLIELVAVLALMAVLAVAALPSTGVISRWKLEAASRALAGDLRMIRQEAITSGKVCKIVFFVYTDSYQIRLAEENIMVRLPEGVSFEGSTTFGGVPPFVHFNMFGRPSGGGTVILKAADGEKNYVIVIPVTGRVRVSKDPPAHW